MIEGIISRLSASGLAGPLVLLIIASVVLIVIIRMILRHKERMAKIERGVGTGTPSAKS